MGSPAARVSSRGRSARWRTGGPHLPGPNFPAQLPPTEKAGPERQPPQPRVPGVAAGPSPRGARSVKRPEVRLGRPRPLPQPAAPAQPDPARRHGAEAPGSRLPAPGLSGQGSQPGAPGGGRAAPSPAPARRSHGRSSRRRPTGRSTGCSARSWWGRASGVGTVRGAAAGGAGARGPTGLSTGCACLLAARLPHRLVGGGAGRRGGETPPSSRPGRGGGHCSSLRPPLAPRPIPALQPRATRLPGVGRCGTEDPPRWAVKEGGRMGWGPLGRRGDSCLPLLPHPSLTRSGQRL